MARKIEVEIIGDASSLERAFGKAGKSTQSFGSALGGALKVGALAAAAGVGIAAVAVHKFADAAVEEQAIDERMRAQLEALGVSYQDHAKHISDVIDKEEQLSGFTKEDLISSFTALSRVTKGDVNAALKDNALAADIARGKGIELSSAQAIVTKASLGMVGALRRQGLDVVKVTTATDALKDAHGKVTQAMKDAAKASDLAATKQSLLATLQKKFAGQAEAYGKTAAGAMDRFHNSIHDIEVSLGTALLPAIAGVGGAAADMLGKISSSLGEAHGFKAKLEVIWTGLQEAAQKLVDAISGALQQVDWSATGSAIVAGVEQGLSKAQEIAGRLSAILSQTMASVNWEQVGTTVGPGIAAGLLAGLATILDPGFWARHWQEMLAVALAVFPFGRLAELGGKIVVALVRPVTDLLGPTLGRAIGAAVDAALLIAERLGPRLGSVFLDAVLLAGRTFARLPGVISGAIGDLGGFVAGKLGSFKTFVIKALAFDAIIHATVAAVGAITDAMGQLPGKVREKLSELAAAIKGYAGSAYAYAFDIGRAIVDGIIGGLGDLASRVGSAISSAVGGAISHVKGVFGIHSPSTVTKEEIGKPLGEGVIEGWVAGSADLPAKMSDKVKQAIEAARQTVDTSRGALSTSFSNLAGDALAAFDAKIAAHQTPTEALIGKEQAAQAAAQLKQNLLDAQAQLASAQADTKSSFWGAIVGKLQGGEAEKTSRADLAEKTRAQQAAERGVQDAKFQILLAAQQKRADAERKNQDATDAVTRANLSKALDTLGSHLAKEGGTAAQATQNIVALLASYGINFAQVGRDMGIAWIQAFKDAIMEAAGKAGKLSAVIGDVAAGISIPTSKKKARGGSVMGGVPYLVGELGPELFVPGRSGTIVPHGAGGGLHIHVGTVIGTSLEKATDEIYAQLLRKRGRNGTLGFA